MIVEALLSVAGAMVSWFADLMPDVVIGGYDPEAVVEFLEYATDSVGALAGWAPLPLIFGGATLLIAVDVAVSVFGFVVWVYHQFWGSQ